VTRYPRPHTGRWRRHLAIAATTAALVAGCSSPTASTADHPGSGTAAPAASTTAGAMTVAHGIQAPITAIPWTQVGPGWMLATWSPVTPTRPGQVRAPGAPTPDTTPTTLYLLSPTGDRYLITTFAPPSGFEGPTLFSWSADGRYVLGTRNRQDSNPIEIDLHTGTQTAIPAPNGLPRFAGPNGTDVLIATLANGDTPGTLKRVDRSGNTEVIYPADQLGGAGQFSGNYLVSPDGSQLVLSTANRGTTLVPRKDNSLVVLSKDGAIVATLPTPMPDAVCSPTRWWRPRVALASCSGEHGRQLWTVPLDGTAPTALTAVNSGQEDDPGFGGDIGDDDAWQLPSGVFLQSEGACGSAFLSRLTPDMHTTRVNVPGVHDSVDVLGAAGDKLLLKAYLGCGGGNSLLTYDPAADTSTVLLGPPVNGGGVTDALRFPDRP
jgi:TolB protein